MSLLAETFEELVFHSSSQTDEKLASGVFRITLSAKICAHHGIFAEWHVSRFIRLRQLRSLSPNQFNLMVVAFAPSDARQQKMDVKNTLRCRILHGELQQSENRQ